MRRFSPGAGYDFYVRQPAGGASAEVEAGTTMVFRVFDRMSYALVMEATREIRVLDTVRNPES